MILRVTEGVPINNPLSLYTLIVFTKTRSADSPENEDQMHDTICKGLVHELLNAQDKVLCSHYAQRDGQQKTKTSRHVT
jgi:hypothetical protein